MNEAQATATADDTEIVGQEMAARMAAGVRAERDQLLRQVNYLASGSMIGGHGDDLDMAAAVASRHELELTALRADLTASVQKIRQVRADAEQAGLRSGEREAELERRLESTRRTFDQAQQDLQLMTARCLRSEEQLALTGTAAATTAAHAATLTADYEAANRRIAELQTSTSWRVTKPMRQLTVSVSRLRG